MTILLLGSTISTGRLYGYVKLLCRHLPLTISKFLALVSIPHDSHYLPMLLIFFVSKVNPYNLNVLLLLEHPQAEEQGIVYYTA